MYALCLNNFLECILTFLYCLGMDGIIQQVEPVTIYITTMNYKRFLSPFMQKLALNFCDFLDTIVTSST